MELVHGPTLAAWIAEGPHPWRRVVDVFLQAGRGLAAADQYAFCVALEEALVATHRAPVRRSRPAGSS